MGRRMLMLDAFATKPRKHEKDLLVSCFRVFVACCFVVGAALDSRSHARAAPLWDTGTFSILGFDPGTGEIGAAVQSRVFPVRNGVLWAAADGCVAATQA